MSQRQLVLFAQYSSVYSEYGQVSVSGFCSIKKGGKQGTSLGSLIF